MHPYYICVVVVPTLQASLKPSIVCGSLSWHKKCRTCAAHTPIVHLKDLLSGLHDQGIIDANLAAVEGACEDHWTF